MVPFVLFPLANEASDPLLYHRSANYTDINSYTHIKKESYPTIPLTVQEARACLLGAVQTQVLDCELLPKVERAILMELRLTCPVRLDERHDCAVSCCDFTMYLLVIWFD